MKPKFGVALYGPEEPQEITREELVALRVFNLVAFQPRPARYYIPIGKEKDVDAFLKQWRAAL